MPDLPPIPATLFSTGYIPALFASGYVFGVVAHEVGHLVLGAVCRFSPKIMVIGQGPLLASFRVAQLRVCLRLLPISGLAIAVPSREPGRAARACFVLGGIAGNMTLFAFATCLAAMDDDLSQWLRPAAFAQLLIVVAVLLPLPRSIRNWRDGTDGLRLIRLLIEPPDDKVARAHRQWLRSMLPDAPEPAVCPFAHEIQFQAHRADRYTDAWALRDSTDALRRLLTGAALVPAERAIILELAIGNELLIGDSGAGLAELDAWSLELLQIAQRPGCQVTRGSVLAVLGRPAEAQAVLAPAMRHPLDALNGIVGRVALAHVHRALGEAERAAAFWPPQADVVAVMTPSLWRTVARIEHLLARHGTGTAATDHRASLP